MSLLLNSCVPLEKACSSLDCSVLSLCAYIPRAWGSLNTNFPDYYTAARLAHEGYDPAHMYEWPWILN